MLATLGWAAAIALAATGGNAAQSGTTFTVSPDGDDSAPGTAEQPWRTLAHAAATATAGSTVEIRAGTYRERLVAQHSGEPGAPITFRAREGERVVISGSGMRGRGLAGLIHVDGQSHLAFEGLVLTGFADKARRERFTPAGAVVTGDAQGIALRRLEVSRISTKRGNAHGIAVYGTERTPIQGVAIEAVNVHDLKLGASEAIVINGNVDGWSVTDSTVDDVNNIGIDAIGFEGTAPADDRARNGVIARNTISDVDTTGNFAYRDEDGGNCMCAGGIYVDGGTNIVIERNRVSRSNLGIELASEHRRGSTSDVLVRSNLVTDSDRAGLTVGGYDTRRGRTERVRVVNNTFIANDRNRDGVGEVEINYRFNDSSLLNNVFVAGRQALMVTNQFRQNSGNVIDGNVWFARRPGDARWQWRRRTARSFSAWQSLTGGDANGRFADPMLSAGGSPLPGSPAIDAGVATDLAGSLDLAGNPRVQGAGIDAGAFETSP